MHKLSALGFMAVLGTAQAAPQTVDCGRLLDVKSGQWREKVSIVVDGSVIQSVGPMSAGAGHIDLSKYACLPGLIDMHVHLAFNPQPQIDALRDAVTFDPADLA